MLKVNYSTKFKRDLKLIQKRNYNIELLKAIIMDIANEKPLKAKHKEHELSGNYSGHKECHILPDWLLIYYIDKKTKVITFVRTGTHSDLF